jgi:hypothetical protein
VDAKNIKCPLEWWEKQKYVFSTIGFLVKQILKIVGFQIETKKKNSLVGIFNYQFQK